MRSDRIKRAQTSEPVLITEQALKSDNKINYEKS